jgi:hypothetical protein
MMRFARREFGFWIAGIGIIMEGADSLIQNLKSKIQN